MAKKKRAINFKAFADDVKEGMTDSDLMGKYNLSPTQLDRVLEKLLDAGRLQLSDIEGRGSGFEATVQVAFTCPSCGALKFFDSSKCPECGFDDSASGGVRHLDSAPPRKRRKPKKKVPKQSSRKLREETTLVEAAVEAAISAKLDQPEPSAEPVEIEEPRIEGPRIEEPGPDLAAEEAELDFKDSLDTPTPEPLEPVEQPEPEKVVAKVKKIQTKKPKARDTAPKKAKGRGKRLALLIAAELLFAVVVLAAVAYFTDMLPLPQGWLSEKPSAKTTDAFKSSGVERQTSRLARVKSQRVQQPDRPAIQQSPAEAVKEPAPSQPDSEAQPTAEPQTRSKPSTVEEPRTDSTQPPPQESPVRQAPAVKEEPPPSMPKERPRVAMDIPAEEQPKEPEALPGPAPKARETGEREKVAAEPVRERPQEPSETEAHPSTIEPTPSNSGEALSSRAVHRPPVTDEESPKASPRMPRLNLGKALLSAINEGDGEATRDLLAAGADPGSVDPSGLTALMHASVLGNAEIVELLLSKGADVNAADKEGNTALMIAAGTGHLDTVKILLEHGADVDIQNSRGVTALGWAYSPTSERVSLKDQRSVVKLLKEYGRRRR